MLRLTSPPLRVTALLALTTLTSLAACGGEDTGTDPDPDPSVSVSVAPASLSVEQGESGSTTVSVTRSGGFTGPVTVTPSGLPSGVSAPPVTAPAGAGSAQLTFTAASDAATGTTDVTLSATGQGVSASTTVELEVTEAPGGGFSLALDPSSVTVDEVPAPAAAAAAGAEPAAAPDATVTVMIARQDPFDGPVELSVTDAPDDLATDLAETSVSGAETTLTVEAMAGLAPGSYTVTVTGSADGVADATAELEVVVEESDGGGGGAFTAQVCDASWFAVKDGDDPWMRVNPGGAGDEYSFDVEAQRVGLAWVQERDLPGGVGESRSVDVFFLDRDEVDLFQDPCETVSDGKTVTGTVTGFGGADFATVQLGFISGSVVPAAPSFTLEGIPDGERHLLVTRATQDAGTGNMDVDRMIVRRNQNLPDGTDLDLDFGASEAFDLGNAQVTLSGLGAEEHVFSAGFVPTGSFFASVGTGGLGVRVDPASPVSIPVVPASNRQAGDLHALLLGGEGRAVFEYHAEPEGQTVELGPALTAPTVTTTTAGQAVFPSGAFATQAEYDEWWSLSFSQGSSFTGLDVELFATEAYLGGDPPELGVPDFTSVDGWDDAWNLVPGSEITWTASAAEGLLDFVFPEDGDVIRVGTAEGTINP